MVCILNHPFASLRVEDDSVEITGVTRLNAPAFEVSVHAGLRGTARYLSGITPRHSYLLHRRKPVPVFAPAGQKLVGIECLVQLRQRHILSFLKRSSQDYGVPK